MQVLQVCDATQHLEAVDFGIALILLLYLWNWRVGFAR